MRSGDWNIAAMIRQVVATLVYGRIERRRAEGKLGNLVHCLADKPGAGRICIGRRHWATHGVPNETKRTSLRDRPRRGRPSWHHRELPSIAPRAGRTRLRLRDADRHQGGRRRGDALSQRGIAAAAGGRQDLGSYRTRIRARHPVRRRARSSDLHPAYYPARFGFGAGEMFIELDALPLAALSHRIFYVEDGR